jgi:RNA polymerase sigma-70 factor (ECF subfamily)
LTVVTDASVFDPHLERDQQWRERICSGDRAAFDALYLAYAPLLFDRAFSLIGSRADAEELVQDVFIAVWQRRDGWAREGSVAGYLLRAVRNRAFNHLRHRRVVRRLEEAMPHDESVVPGMGEPARSPDQLAAANELEALVQQAIDALPERRRLALTLRLVHQMSFAEVGEVMQISEKAAFILVSRARASLQPLLDHFAP